MRMSRWSGCERANNSGPSSTCCTPLCESGRGLRNFRFERNLQMRFVFAVHIYSINHSVSDVAFANTVVSKLGYCESNNARENRFVTLDPQRSQSQIRCAQI